MPKFLENHVKTRLGTDFLFFNPSNIFRIFDENVQKMCYSWKKSKFWLFFLNISKNLRLGEKTKTKTKTKKKTLFLKLNILYMIKVTI